MWKIICLFSLFARALSAPSGCVEMCNAMNSQSRQKLSCCNQQMVSASNDDKNWTDHKDFQTNDGALVHTKDGRYAHGNTHGSFNEMSYYKEYSSGGNQNFGSNFGSNFGTNQHSGSNFGTSQSSGSNYEANQRIEDLSSLSQSSFEASFQSRFAGLIKNFHDSFSHLQELKRKGQLQTQECVHPCIPVNEQIVQLQQEVDTQQQYMQRLREDLWRKSQSQNTVVEPVEQVTVVRQPVQSTYNPGHVTKEVSHHESYHNEKIITHPRITTKVAYQPEKYVSEVQQTHRTGSNQGYHGSSTIQQGSPQYTQDYGPGIQSQTGYDQQNLGYGSQVSGSSIDESRIYGPGCGPNGCQKTMSYGSRDHHGSQSQSGYIQRNSGYESQVSGSQVVGSQVSGSQASRSQTHDSQGCGPQGCPGSVVYVSRDDYGSQSRGGHGSNSDYGSQVSGSLTDRSQGYDSQGCGPQGCQGSVTHVSHGSVSHSMTQNYGVGFGSSDGSLTHGSIQMGSTPDCNDDSHHHQSYSQMRRHKRHSLNGSPSLHRHHHHHHQKPESLDQIPDSQQTEDFGVPAKIQKVTQQEIEDLGQQVDDINRGLLGLNQQTQDFTQQTQNFDQQNQKLESNHHKQYQNPFLSQQTQQNPGFDDYSQHSGNLEFKPQHYPQNPFLSQQTQDLTQHQSQESDQHSGKLEFGQQHQQYPSQIESLSQQTQGFDGLPKPVKLEDLNQQSQIIDYSQNPKGFNQQSVEDLKLEKFGHHQQQQFPSPLSQHSQDFTQQNHGFDDYSQQFQSGRPSQNPVLSQQTQDFTQQQTNEFDQHSGKLEFGQQHQQYPSQIESLSQQTQGFDGLPKPVKLEDLNQQSQTIDFSQHPKGFDQQTVGNLKLDQPARDSLVFNQFPTPVLAPDSNQLQNQRFDGLNQQFNLPAKPAPKPTSRPRKLTQFNLDKNSDTERIFITNQEIQSPFENLRNTGRGDISAENGNSPTDQPLTPHEVSDTDVGYQQSSEDKYHPRDFGQQVQKPGEDFSQQFENPDQYFSQNVQNPFEDFSQQDQKPFEVFSQQDQKPFEVFSQQDQKPFEDFSQHDQKPFEVFSQHDQKPFEDFSHQVRKPFEEFSHQLIKPVEATPVFQQDQKPFEEFSQQVQRRHEAQMSPQMPFKDFSEKVRRTNEDFSQISDLNRYKDITQLPQEPKGSSTQSQDNISHHISSDMTKQISVGYQWHRSHHPGDLTNENLQLKDFTDQVQDTQQVQKTQQIQEIQQAQEIQQVQGIQQIPETQQKQVQTKEQAENEGKHFIKFGQGVESQGSNLQKRNERKSELNLQPRIIEAYGGRGHYDPSHNEDIFSSVRQSPSATLPPFYESDPWDIREKPDTPVTYDNIEDTVAPLDTTWVFPDSLETASPKPGFWSRVGHKITGAVDKAKDKARDIFG